MDFINSNKPSIDIIFGPMFSGKTTELIRRLTIFAEAEMKVLYINSNLDTRGDLFSTHNKTMTSIPTFIHTIKSSSLLLCMDTCISYDVIGIDESQFFCDLQQGCVQLAEIHQKKVIVAGLNGDFQRKPFGEINNLIPYCDNITKLYPFCKSCREIHELQCALFSKRINNYVETVQIGKDDIYLPVCRQCYLK